MLLDEGSPVGTIGGNILSMFHLPSSNFLGMGALRSVNHAVEDTLVL